MRAVLMCLQTPPSPLVGTPWGGTSPAEGLERQVEAEKAHLSPSVPITFTSCAA